MIMNNYLKIFKAVHDDFSNTFYQCRLYDTEVPQSVPHCGCGNRTRIGSLLLSVGGEMWAPPQYSKIVVRTPLIEFLFRNAITRIILAYPRRVRTSISVMSKFLVSKTRTLERSVA